MQPTSLLCMPVDDPLNAPGRKSDGGRSLHGISSGQLVSHAEAADKGQPAGLCCCPMHLTSWFQQSTVTQLSSALLWLRARRPRLTCATVWSPIWRTSGTPPTSPISRTYMP